MNTPITVIHRLPPQVKLGFLFALSIALLFVTNLFFILLIFFAILVLYLLAGFSGRQLIGESVTFFWFILALFIAELYIVGWLPALTISIRFLTLMLTASLVTLTTSPSAMLATLEKVFRFLKPLGINPAKLSLAVALTLRFIPLFKQILAELREAQRTRCDRFRLVPLFFPLMIRTIKLHEDIAAAIEARAYDERGQ